MSKKQIYILPTFLFSFIISIFSLNFIDDFSKYQSVMEGDYNTPWYNPNWRSSPYTNFRLSQHEARYKIQTNAVGDEMWIVKEITVGNKRFWTIDYRFSLLKNIPIERQ